jgi:hypothetical protein
MRKISDQHPVKTGLFVYLGSLDNHLGIQGRAGRGNDF